MCTCAPGQRRAFPAFEKLNRRTAPIRPCRGPRHRKSLPRGAVPACPTLSSFLRPPFCPSGRHLRPHGAWTLPPDIKMDSCKIIYKIISFRAERSRHIPYKRFLPYLEFVIDGLEILGHLNFLLIPCLEFPLDLRVVGLNLVWREERELCKVMICWTRSRSIVCAKLTPLFSLQLIHIPAG